MPPAPTFDYYVELELERSASSQEVTSSFRRLALIHHPDRNHGNQQEATVRFQRLQLAYETLSDPYRRARYDNTRPTSSSPYSDFDDTWDDRDYNMDAFFQRFQTGFPFGGGLGAASGRPTYSAYEFAQTVDEAIEAYKEALRNKIRRQKEAEERQKREEAKEARLRAQKEARKAADIAKMAQRHIRYADEQETQERRWKELNAVTKDERLAACLHSDFCNKIQQQKKFKCSACSAKRGLIAFECPYCSAFLCQLCVTNFSDRRKRLGNSGEADATGTAQDTQNHGEDIDQDNKNKSANEPETTSTNFPFPHGKTTGKKKKVNKNKSGPPEPKATETPLTSTHNPPPQNQTADNHSDGSKDAPVKNNLEDFVAPPNKVSRPQQATDTNQKTTQGGETVLSKLEANKKVPGTAQKLPAIDTATYGPTKSNQKAAAAVEPKGATTVPELTQQKKAATAAGEASSRKTTAIPDYPNGKAQHMSQKPRCTAKPTPGATRGFIRNTKSTQGAPEALLRRAMEQFGTVVSLKIKNKHVGTAHVEFSDDDGLCKAMAASPVVVSDCVAVEVVELKECKKCGRFGHVAAQCRVAKASGRRTRQ